MNDMYISSRRIVSHIGAMSAVYGVTGTLPARARILELGCGKADILLAHALAWPESECVGIDLEPQTVFEAEMRRQKLGAENVALHAMGLDVLVDSQPGEFDYIIINGLFSLLPETERAALLAFAARCLSANGIVALRWNCLPGSRDAKTLQDAIALHAADATDDEMTLSSARAMLVYLELSRQKGRENAVLNTAIAAADNEFMLRYVHNFNDAVYLVDFHQQVTENGFQYVGDSFAQSELAAYYGSSLDEVHTAITPGKGKILSQQYLDFAINREARFSLLVPAQRHVTISDLPDVQAVENLHWGGCFKRFISDADEIGNAHINRDGQYLLSEDPLILSIIDVIGDAWPFSVSFEQIVQNTLLPEEPDNHREKIKTALARLFKQRQDGLLFSNGPSAYNLATSASIEPIFGAFAFNENNDEFTGHNLWGEPLVLTRVEYEFIKKGVHIDDDTSVSTFLSLRDKGALCGSARAWRKAFQTCLKFDNNAVLNRLIISLLMFSSSEEIGGFLKDTLPGSRDPQPVQNNKEKIAALLHRGHKLLAEGKNHDTRMLFEAAIAEDPDDIQILTNLARTYLITGAYKLAHSALMRLLGLYTASWDIYHDLALVYTKNNMPFYAGRIIRIILRNAPSNANAWDLLSSLYRDYGVLENALVCARKAVSLVPRDPQFLANLGGLLNEKKQTREALKYLKRAVDCDKKNLSFYGSYLFALTHYPDISPQALYAKHLAYGDTVDSWAQKVGVIQSWKGTLEPARKIRLGFVSGDFSHHPVSNFFVPFWDSFDRNSFDLIGYQASNISDDVTEHLETTATLWRNVVSTSDPELAQQIYDDEIDILIDLSGHTTYSRLPAFGLRPAPLQMSWIGYPGTTGMKAVDYRILPGFIQKVEKMHEQFSEKVLYVSMEKTFEPHPESPDVSALPAIQNGYLTFGSFNRFNKINDNVLTLWSEILTCRPQTKLVFGAMDDKSVAKKIADFMIDKGVEESQIIFKPRMTLLEYLAEHKNIDIMLDAFPYTGGTTTNHAAWMGVPTLTLRGETLAGCQGLEIMYTYGLEQFIATDKRDYLNKAIYWADNFAELSAIRAGMRNQIPTKKLDGFNIAETLERAFRQCWEMYCRGEAPRSFTVD